jgi:hypothetical protein
MTKISESMTLNAPSFPVRYRSAREIARRKNGNTVSKVASADGAPVEVIAKISPRGKLFVVTVYRP